METAPPDTEGGAVVKLLQYAILSPTCQAPDDPPVFSAAAARTSRVGHRRSLREGQRDLVPVARARAEDAAHLPDWRAPLRQSASSPMRRPIRSVGGQSGRALVGLSGKTNRPGHCAGSGGPPGIRTPNQLIKSQMLCR